MLTDIRHISFDAWNTLIIPNKEFARLRSEEIAKAYGVSYEEGKLKYTETKRFLDTAAELTGFGTTVNNVWKLLNAQFKHSPVGCLDEEDLIALQLRVQEIFRGNLPVVLPEVVDALIEIKDRSITINILSNTNFIGGADLLEHVFDKQFGEEFFNFTLFSDEHQMAKPNPAFFHTAGSRAALHSSSRPKNAALISSCNILHVGDNAITDVQGAEDAGWKSLFVTDPSDLARKFKEVL